MDTLNPMAAIGAIGVDLRIMNFCSSKLDTIAAVVETAPRIF